MGADKLRLLKSPIHPGRTLHSNLAGGKDAFQQEERKQVDKELPIYIDSSGTGTGTS